MSHLREGLGIKGVQNYGPKELRSEKERDSKLSQIGAKYLNCGDIPKISSWSISQFLAIGFTSRNGILKLCIAIFNPIPIINHALDVPSPLSWSVSSENHLEACPFYPHNPQRLLASLNTASNVSF